MAPALAQARRAWHHRQLQRPEPQPAPPQPAHHDDVFSPGGNDGGRAHAAALSTLCLSLPQRASGEGVAGGGGGRLAAAQAPAGPSTHMGRGARLLSVPQRFAHVADQWTAGGEPRRSACQRQQAMPPTVCLQV